MKFNSGTTVTLKATAGRGSTFDGWVDGNGNKLSSSDEYIITLDKDMTVYALFGRLENYKENLIAFPGAEGWGRFTTGGRAVDSRGSKVYVFALIFLFLWMRELSITSIAMSLWYLLIREHIGLKECLWTLKLHTRGHLKSIER